MDQPALPLTMVDWWTLRESWADKLLRLGAGGALGLILLRNLVGQITPSVATNSLTSLLIAVALAVPAVIRRTKPPHIDRRLRWSAGAFAGAYLWMAALYFLKWTGLAEVPQGYDAITDVMGSLFFVGGWWSLQTKDEDRSSHIADRMALVSLTLLTVLIGAAKFVADRNETDNTSIQAAARLGLNLCNGAIFLGLYLQLRRLLLAPDPVTHCALLLFGCAQVAAHARDCLSASETCELPSLPAVIAIAVSWILLLGKFLFGAYVLYLCGHARLSDSKPDAEPPAAAQATSGVASD